MRHKSGIYLLTNHADGKVYVGSAVNIPARRKHHFNRLRANQHRNNHLQAAWNKSSERFSFRVLLYCDTSQLLFFEQRAIDSFLRHLGREHLYNFSLTAGSTLNSRHSAQTRRKIGDARRGKPGFRRVMPEEERRQTSERMKGNQHMRGKTIPVEVRAKIAASLKGHQHSQSALEKMTMASRRYWAQRKAESEA